MTRTPDPPDPPVPQCFAGLRSRFWVISGGGPALPGRTVVRGFTIGAAGPRPDPAPVWAGKGGLEAARRHLPPEACHMYYREEGDDPSILEHWR